MLELFGRGYVIEHCVSTFNCTQKEEAYKAYTSEIFCGIAKQLGLEVSMNYFQLIEQLKPQKEETRTADEIIGGIKDKLRQLGGEN